MELAGVGPELHRYARYQAYLISGVKKKLTFSRHSEGRPSTGQERMSFGVCFAFSMDAKRTYDTRQLE